MNLENSPKLFRKHPLNPILHPSMWPYPANSVFNPGAALFKNEVLLLVRVEDLRGISHLTIARSKDGVTNWEIDPEPTLLPDPENHPEELWGIEDPRIVFLEELGKWAITYTGYSSGGPLVSLALTEDFRTFKRLGPVMPPEDKDAALFPHRFHGRWAMIHRPSITGVRGKMHMWISFSPDLRHWGDHQILIEARDGPFWDANKIGLSPPPLKTKEGWLVMYHGVKETASGCIYRVGLALLDLYDPTKVIRRSDSWVLGPQETYERIGDVADVVFPCGWVLNDNTGDIKLYYGVADTACALAEARLEELLDFVLSSPRPERRTYFSFREGS